MKLESLPNEILLDLFEYFDGADLLRIFYGLNNRFNLLLYKQFLSYRFQFNLISKRDFDTICQQHLPFMANRIVALQLSEYRERSGQISIFLSHIVSFKSFVNLKSLTILRLHSYQILLQLIGECQRLSHLTRLHFYSCLFEESWANSQSIMDKIWTLPKLAHCQLGISIRDEGIFSIPTVSSTSLTSVALFSSNLQWDQLRQFLEYTPKLKCLSAFSKFLPNQTSIEYVVPTLTKFSLRLFNSFKVSNVNIPLPNMPNLRHLNIEIWDGLITGSQWEYTIRNYLPQLQTFRLKISTWFLSKSEIGQQTDELFESFRTPFWIDEHQWFIQCFRVNESIHLYIPFHISNYYKHPSYVSYRSTCPEDTIKKSYYNMNVILDVTLFDKPIPSNICLNNIKYLCIKLPINNRFWSSISNFNQLKTLSVSYYVATFSSQLQRLLERAPYLKKLSISQHELLPFQSSLFKHTNTYVRELDLSRYNYYFNEDECLQLISSPLGLPCEVLSIRVTNRKSIIDFIKHIHNLRSLFVQCSDNDHHQMKSLFGKRKIELAAWLKERLPSTCVITQEGENDKNILIWI